jgi:hypothetical protein
MRLERSERRRHGNGRTVIPAHAVDGDNCSHWRQKKRQAVRPLGQLPA